MTMKKVKTADHQFSTINVKVLFAVCTMTYLDLIKLELYFIKISFLALSGAIVIHAQ